MFKPCFEEAQKIAKGYNSIPVYCEIYSDEVTPVEVLKKLKNVSRQCYILESADDNTRWGRYTFLGYDPKIELSAVDGVVKIKGAENMTVMTDDPVYYIKKIIDECRAPKINELPPFFGGLVGYFSFEFIKYSESGLKLEAADDESFKDFDLMLFDKVIVFDNLRQKIILIKNIRTVNLKEDYYKATAEILKMREIIRNGKSAQIEDLKIKSEFNALFNKDEYSQMVEKAKKYIKDGDIFQVVLSNRLEAKVEGSLLDAYRVLRTENPSPYMFYFGSDDIEIAGASPETLVKLSDGVLYTFPLAGTRARGKTEEQDLALEKELLADEKELAEHNMLVDLGRNDLGRISKFGTVEVEKYLSVMRFSHVMHLASMVRGELRDDKSFVDAIASVLPAGTLSGAPKIRAIEIINELEKSKRGIYGGAIGYIGFSGNMDVCISIRLAFKKNGKVYVRSGAGIVADSVPEMEYEECINKAKAVVNAIKESEGGLTNN